MCICAAFVCLPLPSALGAGLFWGEREGACLAILVSLETLEYETLADLQGQLLGTLARYEGYEERERDKKPRECHFKQKERCIQPCRFYSRWGTLRSQLGRRLRKSNHTRHGSRLSNSTALTPHPGAAAVSWQTACLTVHRKQVK